MAIMAGVDVSKRVLECKLSGRATVLRAANTAKGQLRLVSKFKQAQVALVIVEATGGYERAFCRTIWAAKIPVAVMNPRWTRNFAKSEGRYAKNDHIDADILLLYGERMNPEPTPPIQAEIEQLQRLLTRREQLLNMVVMEKNHEKAPEVPLEIRKSIRVLRRVLATQLAEIDHLIALQIDNSATIKPKAERLRRQTGVGPVLMATLIADMPELGSVRRNVASALIGVAPYDDDSGKRSGKRSIAGGRARPRRALYMATLAAIRHDEHLKAFYKRLLSRGKQRKVAIVACMRKFIIRLNSLLKDDPDQHFLVTNP